MLARVHSFVLQGIDAVPCEVEVDAAERGIARTDIVGLPDAAVRESMDRVRSAMTNCGYDFPMARLLVNLAPADLRKEGSVYDLPIAVGLLIASGVIKGGRHASALIAGELALDGRVRPIRGTISLALMARKSSTGTLLIPADNAPEAAAAEGVTVYPVRTLPELVEHLNGTQPITPQKPMDAELLLAEATAEIDFGEIRGQEAVKRAVTIAAAGGHNLLLIGPAGTGKTMVAKALPGILPPLSRDEALETTCIYSAAGLIPRGQALMLRRPVRTPHHTSSAPAVIGGGSVPRPGEVSLAHHGVLFLDETPEFPRAVLETLRQPMEDGVVTIARTHSTIRYPARFMLVAAMNPTPGGDFATDEASQRQMDKYLAKISGPLVDRIDIHIEVPRIPFEKLQGRSEGTSSSQMRKTVLAARRIQTSRNGGSLRTNATLSGRQLDDLARLDAAGTELLKQAMKELNLSARAYDKIRRVARTIADVEGEADIQAHHVAEAVQYRLMDRKF